MSDTEVILNRFLKMSKKVIWINCNKDHKIVDQSIGFKNMIQLQGKKLNKMTDLVDEKIINNLMDGDPLRVEIGDHIILLHYYDANDHYDLIGDYVEQQLQNVVEQMSIMNQDYMVLMREIDRKNNELENAMSTLKKTQMQLIHEERLAGLGKIASGIAHEINNPLSITMSNMSYLNELVHDLLSKVDDQEIKEDYVDVYDDMQSGLVRIKDIVEAFRLYTNIDAIEAVNDYHIDDGIRSIVEITSHTLLKDVDLDLDLNTPFTMKLNTSSFNQMITHLISNASLALEGRDRKNIAIRTVLEEKKLMITVEDNGCGMSKEVLSHAFDPFYTTRDVGKGPGLGLSVSYDFIVNECSGEININSNLNQGTRVEVVLPI